MKTQKKILQPTKMVKILMILFIFSFNFISFSDNIIEQIENINYNNPTSSLEKVYNVYYNNIGGIFEYQNNIITNILFKKGCWITATNDYSFAKSELALLYALEGNTLKSYKLFYDAYRENTNKTDLLDMTFFDMLSLPTSKWDEVIISKYLSSPHNSYQYALNKSEYYLGIGEYDKAINEAEKAEMKYGNKIGFNFTKFISLYLQKKYNKASIEAEELCNQGVVNKKLAKAFIITAISTTNKNLGVNGFEILFKINNNNFTNKTIYIPYLNYLVKNKLNDKAVELSKKILEADPKNIYARQVALTILAKQNNYKEFKKLSKELLKNNNEINLRKVIGAVALKNKDYDFAYQNYKIIIENACDDPKTYKVYGIILGKLGNYNAASNAFAKMKKLKKSGKN